VTPCEPTAGQSSLSRGADRPRRRCLRRYGYAGAGRLKLRQRHRSRDVAAPAVARRPIAGPARHRRPARVLTPVAAHVRMASPALGRAHRR
jgi:hypothetical protein